jgi:hypothetical protein
MNYRDYYLTSEKAEELVENGGECYIVFEEDTDGKNYDLTQGIFKDLEIARKFVGNNNGNQPLYIAKYSEYVAGNYDYI